MYLLNEARRRRQSAVYSVYDFGSVLSLLLLNYGTVKQKEKKNVVNTTRWSTQLTHQQIIHESLRRLWGPTSFLK